MKFVQTTIEGKHLVPGHIFLDERGSYAYTIVARRNIVGGVLVEALCVGPYLRGESRGEWFFSLDQIVDILTPVKHGE